MAEAPVPENNRTDGLIQASEVIEALLDIRSHMRIDCLPLSKPSGIPLELVNDLIDKLLRVKRRQEDV